MRPGPYVVSEHERLSHVLIQAGGLRTQGYLPGTVFTRTSVQQLQQERLTESRARLQAMLVQASLTSEPTTLDASGSQSDNGGNAGRVAQLMRLQQVLDASESNGAMGRVVLHLTTVAALQNSREDLVLEDGDSITVPQRPVAVNVLGEVYNPTAIIYSSALTVQDYLERAGGATETADLDHVLVVKANGALLTDLGVRNSEKNRLFPLLPAIGGGLMEQRLQAGDTIYVPPRLIYVDKLKLWSTVTQIVANSAQGLAVIGLLATQL
jgi:polysaccharide biosynthesis/export protein